ncbi:MAG: hypothetical protein Q8K98_02730 [Bacteroidota bacterium]|nr:hypothetical protein [Bacteroidota bacterium]
MQNNNFHKKHLRGSSTFLQETEKRPDESVTVPVLKRRNRSKELPTDKSESVSDNRCDTLSSTASIDGQTK